MALFRVHVEVDSYLQLQKTERDALKRLVDVQERQAVALEALVAKANEPDPEPDDPQPAIDALVAKLAQSNTTLADEVAKILAAHP